LQAMASSLMVSAQNGHSIAAIEIVCDVGSSRPHTAP
jgi:hypothetical protein